MRQLVSRRYVTLKPHGRRASPSDESVCLRIEDQSNENRVVGEGEGDGGSGIRFGDRKCCDAAKIGTDRLRRFKGTSQRSVISLVGAERPAVDEAGE